MNSLLPKSSRKTDGPMQDTSGQPLNVGFILIPGFALMCYASAVEPLRAANLIAGREIIRLHTWSPTGAAVPSSSGAHVPASPLPARGQIPSLDMVFVVAGGDPGAWHYPSVHTLLRVLEREGVAIGGISGGPYLMAAAGLLEGYRFTIHWEHAAALAESFPRLSLEQARYVIDGKRLTCGGGIAPLDMMNALIGDHFGADFARRISDWYLHTHVSAPAGPQRATLAERHGTDHPVLLTTLEKMAETMEQPLDRDTMARHAGVSPRHLDRLFCEKLGSTFKDEYRRLRLDRARELLRQSRLSISEIGYACGFSSPGHFARRYRDRFGHTPRQERNRG